MLGLGFSKRQKLDTKTNLDGLNLVTCTKFNQYNISCANKVTTYHRHNSPKTSRRGDSKKTCLQVLRLAIELGVEFVEIEFEVSFAIAIHPHKHIY